MHRVVASTFTVTGPNGFWQVALSSTYTFTVIDFE